MFSQSRSGCDEVYVMGAFVNYIKQKKINFCVPNLRHFFNYSLNMAEPKCETNLRPKALRNLRMIPIIKFSVHN